MKLNRNILLVVALLLSLFSSAQLRSVVNFNNGWKFFLGNDSLASNANFNDAKWRSLNLPHDWSIESSFSSSFPATNQGGALPH
jgi:beta-galactosidase